MTAEHNFPEQQFISADLVLLEMIEVSGSSHLFRSLFRLWGLAAIGNMIVETSSQ